MYEYSYLYMYILFYDECLRSKRKMKLLVSTSCASQYSHTVSQLDDSMKALTFSLIYSIFSWFFYLWILFTRNSYKYLLKLL